MSDSALTRNADDGVTLSAARLFVLLEAAGELEALADLLPATVHEEAPVSTVYGVRALAARVRCLAGVLMSGLDDELEPLFRLEWAVFGSARSRTELLPADNTNNPT